MTLGQRIQELRRQHNLSQEDLGEKLGVSRQAISKWESDITLPEVEKLVVMSRLFSVPVGVLLGVEEQGAPDQPPPKAEGKGGSRPFGGGYRLAAAVLALALIAGAVGGWVLYRSVEENRRLEEQLSQLQSRTDAERERLERQVEALSDRLDREKESLLADWSCTLAELRPDGTMVFALSASPKEYVPGMGAEFFVESRDGQRAAQPGVWDGLRFSARIETPLWDRPGFTVVLDDGESRRPQALEGEEFALEEIGLAIRNSFCRGTWGLDEDGQLTLTLEAGGQIEESAAEWVPAGCVRPEEVWVSVRYDQRELDRLALDTGFWDPDAGQGQWTAGVSGTYQVEPGGELKIFLCIRDSLGRTEEQCLFRRWDLEAGSGSNIE